LVIKEKIAYIIIVIYNGIPWLEKCIKSTEPYPVIVVDNNSTDGTVDFIKKNYPKITLIVQNKDLGFGQANNIGISHALKQGAEYVFLLNQDAYLKKDCIEELLKIHENNRDFGILSPVHLNGRGKSLEKGFSKHLSQEVKKNLISNLKKEERLENIYDVPFVNAAGWLISKECLLKVGGFDPTFFHYGEDVNYVQRIKYFGFKVGVSPGAFMCHDREGSAIKEGSRFSERYFINVERRFKMKWADLNIPKKMVEKDIESNLDGLKKERQKSLLNLQLVKAKKIGKEIKLINRCKKEIFLSRERNLSTENIFSE